TRQLPVKKWFQCQIDGRCWQSDLTSRNKKQHPYHVIVVRVSNKQNVGYGLVTASAISAAATTAAVAASAATAAVATPPPTSTPASTTPVRAATATAALTWLTGLGFVDRESPALEGSSIHFCDGFVSPTFHFHEAEAAGPARFAIDDHLSPSHSAMRLEGG